MHEEHAEHQRCKQQVLGPGQDRQDQHIADQIGNMIEIAAQFRGLLFDPGHRAVGAVADIGQIVGQGADDQAPAGAGQEATGSDQPQPNRCKGDLVGRDPGLVDDEYRQGPSQRIDAEQRPPGLERHTCIGLLLINQQSFRCLRGSHHFFKITPADPSETTSKYPWSGSDKPPHNVP